MRNNCGGFKAFSWLFRILLSLAVLAIVINWVGAEHFFQALRRLDGLSLVAVCLLMSASIAIRGWRFRVVQESSICGPRIDYVVIATFHNAASQIMPFRSGELAFPVLANRFFGHPMSRSAASLLLIRFIEVFVLGALVVMAIFFLMGEFSWDKSWVMIATASLLLMLGLLWRYLPEVFLLLHGVLKPCVCGGSGWLAKSSGWLVNALHQMSQELNKAKSAKVYLLALILTVINWLILIGICWVVLLGLGVQVNYAETIVGSSIASIAQFVPLGSVGNIGPMEAGWTMGFVMVGIDAKTALNSGMILHLVVIFCSLILAGLAWAGIKWRQYWR